MKRNKKPKFSLNIHEIKKECHELLEKKANDIKNENLTHDQKIMFVLKGEKDTTVVKNNIKEDLEKREINISTTIKENDLDKKEEKLYKEKNDIINKKEEMKIKQEEINKKLKKIMMICFFK